MHLGVKQGHRLHFPFLRNKLVLNVTSNTYLIEGRFNDSRLVDSNNVGHQDFFFCIVILLRIVTFPSNEYCWKLAIAVSCTCCTRVVRTYIECNWRYVHSRFVFRSCVYGFSWAAFLSSGAAFAAQQRKWLPKRSNIFKDVYRNSDIEVNSEIKHVHHNLNIICMLSCKA